MTDEQPTAWILGGGTVAQCYAHFLLRAGFRVRFIVREARARRLQTGFCIRDLNASGRPVIRYPFGAGWDVALDVPSEGSETPSVVVQAVDSPALRSEWMQARLDRLPTGCPVVVLQPGIEDLALVGTHTGTESLIPGVIALIAWPAPLEGEASYPEDTASMERTSLWLPPGGALPFGGPEALARPLVEALRAGGTRAKWSPSNVRSAAVGGAVMVTAIATLNAADWSLARMRSSPFRNLAAAAAREAISVVEAKTETQAPATLRAIASPVVLGALAGMGPWFVPFPLETYLEVHFTKVAEQTRMHLRGHIEGAAERGLPHEALDELMQRLRERDAGLGQSP
jgi:ketopantoate reductase